MNKDEIKGILSLLNSSSWSNETKQIEDYITDLEEVKEKYNILINFLKETEYDYLIDIIYNDEVIDK